MKKLNLILFSTLGLLTFSGIKAINTMVINAEESFVPDYVHFHIIDDVSTSIHVDRKTFNPNIEYSYDLINWNTINFEESSDIPMNFVHDVYVRGNNPNGLGGSYNGTTFTCLEQHNVSGDLSTLLSYTTHVTDIRNLHSAFCKIFADNTGLVDAGDLIISFDSIGTSCFENAFIGCSNLLYTPEIQTNYVSNWGCEYMFKNCTNLIKGPSILPANYVELSAYSEMFYGCKNLKEGPAIKAASVNHSAMDSMFEGCSSLETIPSFDTTKFGNNACFQMFSGCDSLINFPEIHVEEGGTFALGSMFFNCKALKDVKLTLNDAKLSSNCFENMFTNCSSLQYLETNLSDWKSESYTRNWLSGVSANGYLVGPSSLDGSSGASYIPNGWTRVDGLYKITFDKNGGQGPNLDYVKVPIQTNGYNYILPACPFVSKESTAALGWGLTPISHPIESTFLTITEDMTLYGIYYLYTYKDVEYIWDGNTCSASRVCEQDDSLSIYETKQASYVKDSDATCGANEFGHYEVEFESVVFTKQETAPKSVEIENTMIPHAFYNPDYTWDGSSCTATRVCARDDTHIETETVQATLIIDTQANCSHNAFGHYEVEFENPDFERQYTEENSFEIENTKLPHNFASPGYTFIDETTCKATRVCKDDPSHYEEEIVTATYVKDVDATCLTNEFGHYEFIFENQAFKTQRTEANSLEVKDSATGHNFATPIYVWNVSFCVATKICQNDASHTIFEIVNGTLIIDTPATCTTNAFGHFEASFKDDSFTTQVTEANSYEVLDTATGHHYTKVDFSWNEDFTKCFASAICDCGHQEEFVSDAIFVKDSDATCSTNIKGHQEASFELFETHKTPENSIELGNTKILEHVLDRWVEAIPATHLENGSLGHYECKYCHKCFDINGTELESIETAKLVNHNFEDITYSYDSETNKVVATATCECNETISETVDAKIMGQYVVAEFENDIFTTQYYPYENGNNNNNKERKGLPIYVYIGGGLMLAVIGVLLVFLKKKKTISI